MSSRQHSDFDSLSDYAYVPLRVVKSLYGCSASTVWRRVKSGEIPEPKKLGVRSVRWNVGDLRKSLDAIHAQELAESLNG